MREKKKYPPSKKCPLLVSAQFCVTLDSYFYFLFFKEATISVFLFRAGGLLTAGRQKTRDQRRAGSETGECPPTPASGMLASVRLNAHSQLEPHCCLAHSAGRECQLLPPRTKVRQSYYKFTNKGPSNAAISLP